MPFPSLPPCGFDSMKLCWKSIWYSFSFQTLRLKWSSLDFQSQENETIISFIASLFPSASWSGRYSPSIEFIVLLYQKEISPDNAASIHSGFRADLIGIIHPSGMHINRALEGSLIESQSMWGLLIYSLVVFRGLSLFVALTRIALNSSIHW